MRKWHYWVIRPQTQECYVVQPLHKRTSLHGLLSVATCFITRSACKIFRINPSTYLSAHRIYPAVAGTPLETRTCPNPCFSVDVKPDATEIHRMRV